MGVSYGAWIDALTAASKAVCLIVSVDETIKNPYWTVDASQLLAGAEVMAAPTEISHPSHEWLAGWQQGVLTLLSYLIGITRER